MDALLNAALAGTSRAGGQVPPPATPADALVTPSPNLGVEHHLLLAAGTRAIYRRAGLETRLVAAASAAPDDAAPFCSLGAAHLIARMLTGEQDELLPEALERLNRAGQRLPHALLPAALDTGSRRAELRPALLVAIGERGRWLAGHRHPWRWATARPVVAGEAPPPDAEALWEEGPPAQRLAILRQVRAYDPAQGRAWLEATWKGEKADFRAEALQALETGLSAGDEPFLEAALDDRSQTVRPEAVKLLAKLPDSAFTLRLRDCADRFLAFSPGLLAGGWRAAAKALVTGASGGKLTVIPPEMYDKAWGRDGIIEKPPHGIGARAWWLQQFLSLIPPAHWSARFGADPATLIAAAAGSEWGEPTFAGWSQAAFAHGDAAWAVAFWQRWTTAKNEAKHRHAIGTQLASLARLIPQQQAEELMLDAIVRLKALDDLLVPTLQLLPRPWSTSFTSAILRQAHDRLKTLFSQSNNSYYGEPWLAVITQIALAIPPSSFHEALALREFETKTEDLGTVNWWQRRITDFAELVRTRQRLMEEIPL